MEKNEVAKLIDEKIRKHAEESIAHSEGCGTFLLVWLMLITAIILAIEVFPHIKII